MAHSSRYVATDSIGLTLSQALAAGYRIAGEAYAQGYISRKQARGDALVYPAGSRGSRVGQFYALLPCWKSTRYCIRIYLLPPA